MRKTGKSAARIGAEQTFTRVKAKALHIAERQLHPIEKESVGDVARNGLVKNLKKEEEGLRAYAGRFWGAREHARSHRGEGEWGREGAAHKEN